MYRSVHAAFRQCANALTAGTPLADASMMLRQHPDVLRCFVLNQFGEQVGDNVGARGQANARRFAPLADARGARWSRRPYFRSAMEQPGRVQLTQPYLSVTEPVSCVTMSLALEIRSAFTSCAPTCCGTSASPAASVTEPNPDLIRRSLMRHARRNKTQRSRESKMARPPPNPAKRP